MESGGRSEERSGMVVLTGVFPHVCQLPTAMTAPRDPASNLFEGQPISLSRSSGRGKGEGDRSGQ